MSKLITQIKRLALALCFVTPLVSWADAITAVNPVTGETETYTYKYVGESSTWTATDWQDSSDPAVNPGAAPQTPGSNVWDPILIDGSYTLTAPTLEGWAIRLGLYNGAQVTVPTLNKIQAGTTMWFTVDATSKLTLSLPGTGHLGDNQNVNFYVAAPQGLVFNSNFATSKNDTDTFNYYLAGDGSVSFQGISAGTHKIKMADVTLSGSATPSVESKTLVSFTSTTKTFTADAAIKVYGTDGETLVDTVNTATVNTTGTTTLTEDSAVGSCELVQTSTGIDLYFVNGDPSSIVAKEYKPSININFTSGTALSTAADVGVGDYAVPGTSWNNLIGNNGTLSTVTQVDSTGAASTVAGVGVTISGTRGYWACGSVTAATDLRQGYIDDADGANASPQVVVSGIPYYSYYAVVYFSNNDANVPFGYVTINGTNYKWDSENSKLVECEGANTDSWGASSPTAWTEGGNYIVTPTIVNADGTFTIVSHRLSSSIRSGIAAIQIVEVPKQAADGELVINVSGDTTYPVSENATYTTVYVTGIGTLAFDGEGTITTTTLNVGAGATVPMGSSITPTTVTGAGTVVYDGAQPSTTLGFDDSDKWFGTVWVKNIGSNGESSKVSTVLGTDTATATGNVLKDWGNENSSVKFTNVRGWTGTAVCPWTLILEDDGTNYAWYNNNGYAARSTTFAALKGSGTFYDKSVDNKPCRQKITFTDGSQFTGALYAEGKRVGLGGENTRGDAEDNNGTIEVVSGATATVASGKTWTAGTGSILVTGTLYANGTLAGTSTTRAVRGSGTVVFTGSAPSPTGDAWWKNSDWTGTVQIAGVSNMTGNNTGTQIAFNDYGNEGSIVELNNVTGWLPNNFTCTPKLKVTGTLSLNNGSSGKNNAFKVGTLLGSGTISGSSSAPTAVFNVTSDWSGFTGGIGLNSSKCVVFGETIPDTLAAGTIYISEGAVAEIKTSDNWWATGGIVVNGTLKATGRDKWGGGTAMTLGDTGVLELTSTANTQDYKDYSGVTGTGTIKYSSTAGWRLFPDTSAKMPATTLTIQTELADSLIIACTNDTVIGNLAGSKNIRSDWGDNSANGRTLTVTQSKDTEWSGKFVSNRITQFNVNPGASTTGTLTLSGTQTVTMPATISGSVNLTGTWVGATIVSGTFGGTGTLTGDLTFSEGATFKVFATDDNGLAVSGTVTCPAEGTVTVDASALEDTGTFALLTASELDADKFALAEGAPEGATLAVVEGVLTLTVPTPSVSITIPKVENATVVVTVDGVPVTPENGVVTAQVGAAVVVTYTAAEGYTIANGTIEFAAAADTTTVDTSNVTVSEYIAWIYDANGDLVGDPYTTEFAAVQAFLANNIGNSIRFKTSIESSEEGSFHQMLISVCSYDSETLTYTRLPVVANVTSGQFTVGYTSLASAVANVLDGSVVTLVANVTLDERVDVNPGENTTLTIDLGGYTLTREGTSGNGSVFDVKSGIVTIKNGTIDCTQDDTAIAKDGVYAITARAGSVVTLETLDITVNSECGACAYPFAGSTMTIKSGTYENTTTTPYRYKTAWTGMAVNQPNNAVQILFLEGGTYSKVDPKLGDDSGEWTNFCAAGKTTRQVEGGWEVVNSVAEVVNGKAYASLAEAVANAADGDTVKLLANITLDARVEPNLGANTTLTIDLGGYTITRTGTSGNGSVFDVKSGTVTIKNGTIDCTQDDTEIAKDGVYAITARSGSVVTLETLDITVNSECGACAYPFAGSTMTIKSGTYENTTTTPYRYKTAWTGMAVNQANNAVQILFLEGGTYSQVDPKLGDDSGKWTNFCAAGKTTRQVEGGWEVVDAGIDPTKPDSEQEVTPTAEEIEEAGGSAEAAAKAKATVTVPDAVKAVVEEATYKSYFTLSATETAPGSGVYEVTIVDLNEDAVFPTSESDDLTADLADVLDADTGDGVAITTAKPGLYYSIEAATDLGFTEPEEGARTLATGTTVSPKKPAVTGTPTAVFYRVKVSTTQE